MASPIVAITGASGSVYGVRLIRCLIDRGLNPYVVISDSGKTVMRLELGTDKLIDLVGYRGYQVEEIKNFAAPFSSGSFPTQGMAVAPCSMGTLAAIAHGLSQNLIHRAADVCLKEKRKLIIVPREMPMHLGHLRNLATVAEFGATVIPAMPAFYQKPETMDDLVDTVVARILDHLGVEHNLVERWRGDLIEEDPLRTLEKEFLDGEL